MKKGTIIALVISIIYCGLSTYVLFNFSLDSASEWNITFFVPGYFLGLFGGMRYGISFAIVGQIITFLFMFYILSLILNLVVNEYKKSKN